MSENTLTDCRILQDVEKNPFINESMSNPIHSSNIASPEQSFVMPFHPIEKVKIPSTEITDVDKFKKMSIEQGNSNSPSVLVFSSPAPEMSLCTLCESVDDTMQLPLATALSVHRTLSKTDILEEARDFSGLSSPEKIREICQTHIQEWDKLSEADVVIDQIMFGLSNQLFSVQVREDYIEREKFKIKKVLFRIYGKDVNTIYNSADEVKLFKELARRGVAPSLIAEFEGGRIEEWLDGGALLNEDMQKTSVIIGAAAIIANIHLLNNFDDIDRTSMIDKYLSRWREGAMKIYDMVKVCHPSYLALQRMDLPKLCEESFKLKKYLFPDGVPLNEVVQLRFCHNDIQENNILVNHNSMRLIDFEYSGYNYPAYDIASFFWEMTCDYTVSSYPFFRIDPTKYPSLEKRRMFCAMYLTTLTKRAIRTSQKARIDAILDSVDRFELASHLLWSFWAVIRAPQAATATSFDMLYYGQKRVDAYWSKKAQLLSRKKIEP